MINSCAAIVIAAKHGELTKVRDCEGIAYTVGTLRCKFDFRTTDWNYTTRTAVFCKGNVATSPNISDKAIGVLLDNVDECAVPPEVLLPDEKYFSVGVWGVTAEGLRIVSEWLVFRIKDGCYVNSSESIPPTPTVYEQIITQINSKAPIEHEHTDKYYLKEDIDKKFENISLEIDIPTKVSELENDRGYITDYIETDPTVPEWAKNKNKPTYTASEVGADPKGSAANALGDAKQYIDNKISAIDLNGKISAHNTNTSAHNDIRLKIQAIADKLNTFLDADDTTLDQMSEIVAYIKSNKELIDSVTTSKVNVGDIVDNLITTTSNKPLSAKQGVVLKSLIDDITIPSNISELKNDVGYLKEYIETDPTVPEWAKAETKPSYTADEVGALSNTTVIPSKVSQLENDKGYLTQHQDISGKADKKDTYTKTEVERYIDEQTEIIKSDVEGLQTQINEEAHFRGYISTNEKVQALEATPNDFTYSAESGTKWIYDAENGWQDSGTPVPDQLTPASETTPLINGVASVGTENAYARGDHRHPTDTTRLSVEEFNEFKSELELGLDRIIAIQNSLIGGGSE